MALRSELKELLADFEKRMKFINIVRCVLDYKYPDAIHVESGRKIADKHLLTDGKLELTDTLPSGKYEFTIYEAEEDDSGFDDILYEKIYSNQRELINSNNLSGQFLEIRRFRLLHNSNLYKRYMNN